ncbi:MAG: terminase large subunit domain-containing protein [Candidatus Limnocylindrales bacterium]
MVTGARVHPAARELSSPIEAFRLAFGLDPYPYQVALLEETRDTLVLKSRQSGFTTAIAALCLWVALHQPGSLSAVISPSLRQSTEAANIVREGAYAVGSTLIQDAVSILKFENGSRVLSLAGASRAVRGYAVDGVLVLDEAAFIKPDTIVSARPITSAAHGRTIVQSTPGVPSGAFFDLWTGADEAKWAKFRVTADQVPGITAEWLDQQRREINDVLFRQEYFCEFALPGVAEGVHLFRSEDIEAAFAAGKGIPPLLGGKR